MFVLPAIRQRKPAAATGQAAGKRRRAAVPKITETDEHRTIAAYFRKVGLGGTARAIHIRNERSTGKIAAWQMGMVSGLPDWLFVDCGRAGWIELKRRGWKAHKERGGKYTPHEERQREVHRALKTAGCWVEICESLDEVLDALAYHGVPLRSEPAIISAMRGAVAAGEGGRE